VFPGAASERREEVGVGGAAYDEPGPERESVREEVREASAGHGEFGSVVCNEAVGVPLPIEGGPLFGFHCINSTEAVGVPVGLLVGVPLAEELLAEELLPNGLATLTLLGSSMRVLTAGTACAENTPDTTVCGCTPTTTGFRTD